MLQISKNFNRDIQSRDTNLTPIVSFNSPTSNNITYISTISDSLDGNIVLPVLLNIPTLKESIDIQKRNYKIPSISISISNVDINGERFSEVIDTNYDSFINTECRIYWISPSARNILNSSSDDSALQIYSGVVRRYSISKDTITINVEDYSQAILHKDLPLPNDYQEGQLIEENWTGASTNLPDKYKNKVIPVVYGEVKNSPLVVTSAPSSISENTGNLQDIVLKVDSSESSNIDEGSALNPVSLYAADRYLEVQSKLDIEHSGQVSGSDPLSSTIEIPTIGGYSHDSVQFNIDGNKIIMPISLYSSEFISPTYDNHIIAIDFIDNSKLVYSPINEISTHWTSLPINHTTGHSGRSWYNAQEGDSLGDVNTFGYIFGGTCLAEEDRTNWKGGSHISGMPSATGQWNDADLTTYHELYNTTVTPSDDHHERAMVGGNVRTNSADLSSIGVTQSLLYYAIEMHYGNTKDYSGGGQGKFQIRLRIGGRDESKTINTYGFDRPEAMWYPLTENESNDTGPNLHHGWMTISNPQNLLIYSRIADTGTYGWAATAVKFHIQKILLYNYVLIENVLDQSFYANVNGRKNNNNQLMTNIHEIINNILIDELKYPTDNQWISNELSSSYADELDSGYLSNWRHDFTIDKKINSKKLMENIASTSPYIPRFDSMGNFKFDVIPDNGGSNIANTVNSEDVISFTFNRTPIEEVYTKVDFHYHWDYALDNFTKQVPSDQVQVPANSDIFNVYGLPVDHSQSTLVISDDRGKYIRDPFTAVRYAKFMLNWHKNQHLKIKIKLPLKYLNLEVGGIIKFSEYIGNKILPYGIDYLNGGSFKGGQTYYNTFQIISTNKTLEYIDIEALHLHQIDSSGFNYESCYDEDGVCIESNCPVDQCGVCGGNGESCIDMCGDVNGNNACVGCTDPDACNFDQTAYDYGENAINKDCYYAPECYDCDGNCICDEDEDGVCDDADTCIGLEDACGVCNGDNSDQVYSECTNDLYCLNDEEQLNEYNSIEEGCGNFQALNYNPDASCPANCYFPYEDVGTYLDPSPCVTTLMNADVPCFNFDICPEKEEDVLNYICVNYPNRCGNYEEPSKEELEERGVFNITGLTFYDIYPPDNDGEASRSEDPPIAQRIKEYYDNGCFNGDCSMGAGYYPLLIKSSNCRRETAEWNLSNMRLSFKDESNNPVNDQSGGNNYADFTINYNPNTQVNYIYLTPDKIEQIHTGHIVFNLNLSGNMYQEEVENSQYEIKVEISKNGNLISTETKNDYVNYNTQDEITAGPFETLNFKNEAGWSGSGTSNSGSSEDQIEPFINIGQDFNLQATITLSTDWAIGVSATWVITFLYDHNYCPNIAGNIVGLSPSSVDGSDYNALNNCLYNYENNIGENPWGYNAQSSPCVHDLYGSYKGCSMRKFIDYTDLNGLYYDHLDLLGDCIDAIVNGEVVNCDQWLIQQGQIPDEDDDDTVEPMIDCCRIIGGNEVTVASNVTLNDCINTYLGYICGTGEDT